MRYKLINKSDMHLVHARFSLAPWEHIVLEEEEIDGGIERLIAIGKLSRELYVQRIVIGTEKRLVINPVIKSKKSKPAKKLVTGKKSGVRKSKGREILEQIDKTSELKLKKVKETEPIRYYIEEEIKAVKGIFELRKIAEKLRSALGIKEDDTFLRGRSKTGLREEILEAQEELRLKLEDN